MAKRRVYNNARKKTEYHIKLGFSTLAKKYGIRMLRNYGVTRKDITTESRLSKSTIENYLPKLKRKGIIRTVEKGRGSKGERFILAKPLDQW